MNIGTIHGEVTEKDLNDLIAIEKEGRFLFLRLNKNHKSQMEVK